MNPEPQKSRGRPRGSTSKEDNKYQDNELKIEDENPRSHELGGRVEEVKNNKRLVEVVGTGVDPGLNTNKTPTKPYLPTLSETPAKQMKSHPR